MRKNNQTTWINLENSYFEGSQLRENGSCQQWQEVTKESTWKGSDLSWSFEGSGPSSSKGDSTFKGTGSVFLLLRVLAIYEGTGSVYNAYKLVRITVDDETGKQIFFYMNLSPAEADQLKDYRLTLWD